MCSACDGSTGWRNAAGRGIVGLMTQVPFTEPLSLNSETKLVALGRGSEGPTRLELPSGGL